MFLGGFERGEEGGWGGGKRWGGKGKGMDRVYLCEYSTFGLVYVVGI